MKTKRTIMLIALTMLSFPTIYAQTYEWQKPIQPTETFSGTISKKYKAGYRIYDNDEMKWNDRRKTLSIEQLYQMLLNDAKTEYGERIILRNFVSSRDDKDQISYGSNLDFYYSAYNVSASVCVPNSFLEQSKPKVDPLEQALNKALRNVREGSRLAIDQVTVSSSMDRGEFKDQLIDVLLDKGYKVVAKEYLAQLYEEQQNQQSGIYNDRTTVQENNFSAVGYYINVKVTETSLRVQVVNVSTGEYEGNATVNF